MEIKEITMTDLRNSPGKWVTAAVSGTTIQITRNGEIVAKLQSNYMQSDITNIETGDMSVIPEKKVPVLTGVLLPEWEQWGYEQSGDFDPEFAYILRESRRVGRGGYSRGGPGFYTKESLDEYKSVKAKRLGGK